MLPFSMILSAFGPTLVRSLVAGQQLGPSAYADITDRVLSTVLDQQADVGASLARIDVKLDALLVQDYEHALAAGHRAVDFAVQPWREATERDEELSKARDMFSRAAASAGGDAYRLAVAEWYVAVISLLKGQPMDARRSLGAATRAALTAMYDADSCFVDPASELVKQTIAPGTGWYARTLGGAEEDARVRVRERAVTRGRSASDLLSAAREICLALGERAVDCPLYWYAAPPRDDGYFAISPDYHDHWRWRGALREVAGDVRALRKLPAPPCVVREAGGPVLRVQSADVQVRDCVMTGSTSPVWLRLTIRYHEPVLVNDVYAMLLPSAAADERNGTLARTSMRAHGENWSFYPDNQLNFMSPDQLGTSVEGWLPVGQPHVSDLKGRPVLALWTLKTPYRVDTTLERVW